MIRAELDPNRPGKIAVRFKFDQNDVLLIKTIKGRLFHDNGKYWTIPQNIIKARELRECFGRRLCVSF